MKEIKEKYEHLQQQNLGDDSFKRTLEKDMCDDAFPASDKPNLRA